LNQRNQDINNAKQERTKVKERKKILGKKAKVVVPGKKSKVQRAKKESNQVQKVVFKKIKIKKRELMMSKQRKKNKTWI
jgi:hypothetical protein